MGVQQVVLADREGNLTPCPVEHFLITVPEVADDSDTDEDVVDYWEWTSLGKIPFQIKMQAAGVLKVALIGEDETAATLMPFHEGWNAERVWRVYADDDNDYTGLVVAGR